MNRPETGDERRTPLTVSMGARRVPARQTTRQQGSLPTVEEVSAGGVIIRPASTGFEVAIIARYNRGGRLEWCLPKGHPEGDETFEEAALREVAEETGVEGAILTSLGSIEYWFTVPSHRIHKTVHHYLMEAIGGELSIENDPDHEAVDVAWVSMDALDRTLSFPNERRIVNLAKAVIDESVQSS